ncbi:hypothetical protein U9M48_016973 [Paspalum notatum var. saurae]|uniref:Uncharacterized protein n=1 Tax=Paspalum notatum var. saurae TaxID=547442 RepID=A0AAQ3WN44_PASNO
MCQGSCIGAMGPSLALFIGVEICTGWVDHYNPSEDDNLSGGKVAVPIEGIRKALANVLKELGKTRVEDDGFPIKYMSFHGTLNKILNIHAPGELLVIIKSVQRPLTRSNWPDPSTCFTGVVSLKFGKSGSCSAWKLWNMRAIVFCNGVLMGLRCEEYSERFMLESMSTAFWYASEVPFSLGCLCKDAYFLKCASHLDSPAAMGVPQRRQQVRRRPESWLLSFSMTKWYRFPHTGYRDRRTSSSTTLSSTLPPLSSSPASPTLRETLQIRRCGGAAAAAGEKIDGRGSSLACFARNPLTASLNVPAAPPSPAAGNPAKSLASTRALALFSGRPFTTISPSAAVGSPRICTSTSSSSSSISRIGTRVRVCGGGGG